MNDPFAVTNADHQTLTKIGKALTMHSKRRKQREIIPAD